jgi:enoyl-CoA hydratase/3-hydroxypropionyl-coenzyme A dehydratase
MSDAVLRHEAGGVRWITLNRPRAANAIDTALADGLAAELSAAAADDTVKAVVLTGAGTRVFCAGVDIRNGEGPDARRRNLRTCFWSVLEFPKPLVAAVNGVASGGGCMLALLADQRVIADDTAFVLPEIDIGIPTYPALAILSLQVGDALAADLVLSGRRFPAAEASRWGLATAAPSGDLAAVALAHATALGGKPAETYRLCKMWLNRRLRSAIEDATSAGAQLEGRG